MNNNKGTLLPPEKFLNLNRLISLIIVIIYIVIALVMGGFELFVRLLGVLILPVGMIWYGEEVGRYTGNFLQCEYVSPSPGWLVTMMGWVLLIAIALIPLLAIITK